MLFMVRTGQLIPRLVGSWLVIAGILKLYQYMTDPIALINLEGNRWPMFAVCEIEILLGFCLVLGFAPILSRIIASLVFALFATLNVYKLLMGQTSCGCLGAIEVHPRTSLGLSVACLLLLVIWLPRQQVRRSTRRTSLIPSIQDSTVLVLSLCLLLITMVTHFLTRPHSHLLDLVELSPSAHDFGEVERHRELRYVFQMTNGWSKTITISKVVASCGCTTVDEVTGRSIQPHELLEIPVTLHAGDGDGLRRGTVSVFYQAEGQRTPVFQSVVLSATIRSDYLVRPRLVDFGTIESSKRTERIIRVRPDKLSSLQVINATCDHPAFQARVMRERTSESDIQIKVSFGPERQHLKGQVNCVVELQTTSAVSPTYHVMVQAYVLARFTVSSSALVIGAETTGVVYHTFTIISHKPATIDLKIPPGMLASIKQHSQRSDGNYLYPIEVTFTESTESGLNAELTIELRERGDNSQESYSIAIPVHRLPSRKGNVRNGS